jgi:YHS domain-containing protein
MAGIDYSIPGQIKSIQVESPINAMSQAMQLRGLQESSQMNALRMQEQALKAQEYQRGVESRNKLARIHADPKVKIGSPEYLERVYTEVPDLYNDVATKIANRENVLSQIETREAAAEKSRFDLDQAKKKRERDEIDLELKQFNDQFPAYNIKSEQDVEDRIVAMANNPTLGSLSTRFGPLGDTIARNKAEFRRDPRNYVARLSGVSAEEILKAADAREAEDYSNYKVAEIFAGRTPLDRESYLRSRRGEQVAAPAAAPAPAPASAAVDTTAPAEVTTTPDGTKTFSGVTKVASKQGFDYLDVTAQRLLQLAATAKTDREAAAYKAAAEKIQAAHVKFLEDQEKRNRPTGEFFNVPLARKKIQELRKLPPTKENLEDINDLLDLIKTAKEGLAPKVSNVIKMPPGPKAVDERYANDYLEWTQGGGADAAANSAQIKQVLDRFAAGEKLTGPSIGLAPDFFNALVNPEALGAKQAVEEVVQRNLRAVLGAQFTQVEGERLISRAFDARLKPQENAKRLRKLFLQMQTAAQQKQAMAEYYEANETLRGFKGKQPKMQDFFDVLTAPDAPPKGSVDVRAPDGKVYRFSNQQAADKFKKDNGIKD